MRAGHLRHRIAIQTDTETRDSDGGIVHNWSTDETVWGAVNPVAGDEKIDGQRYVSTATHKITIRYYSGQLTPSQRLVFGLRIFGILSIMNKYERDREIQLICKELT